MGVSRGDNGRHLLRHKRLGVERLDAAERLSADAVGLAIHRRAAAGRRQQVALVRSVQKHPRRDREAPKASQSLDRSIRPATTSARSR